MLEPLINRMKTDDVNRMIEYSHKYPISGQALIDTLMKSTIWLDLKYDTICQLHDVFGCGYRPTAIYDIFNNK